MSTGRSDNKVPDDVPTLGDGPSREATPSSASGMLKRDQLLSRSRSQPAQDDDDIGEDNLLVKLLLIGVVLFVAFDIAVFAYKFGWVGGHTAPARVPAPQVQVEAPKPEPPPKRGLLEGVQVKDGMSEGLVKEPAPQPAQRPVEPPGM